MKVIARQELPNGVNLCIVEVNNPIIQNAFDDRFQILVEIGNKKFLPKSKRPYINFKENNYLYILKSKKISSDIEVSPELFYEKKLCDKTLDDCTKELLDYVGIYNEGKNILQEIRNDYTPI